LLRGGATAAGPPLDSMGARRGGGVGAGKGLPSSEVTDFREVVLGAGAGPRPPGPSGGGGA